MKTRISILILTLLVSASTMAKHITMEEARQHSISFLQSGKFQQRRMATNLSNYKLVLESKAYYVFSAQATGGYIIAAADDEMAQPVLGYSDGTFSVEDMPENMKWWLSEYDAEAEWLSKQTIRPLTATTTTRTAIKPLLTSQWNQDDPYNRQCPQINSKSCPTGCVATAMAQIMYYHKWPQQGKGSISYTWSAGSKTLSADFSKSTYDWSSMTDTYNNLSSTAACNAVALLMKDVGYSVNMSYTADGSGTLSKYVPHALSTYFSYSKQACYYVRAFYSTTEWEDMVYASLERKEPVYYAGAGSAGHAFVCDGYANGYYHFNWGWGGTSNGYFLLSALQPDVQGWGGSANGYSAQQEIVVNIRPDKDATSKIIANMTSYNNFSIKRNTTVGQYTMGTGLANSFKEAVNIGVGIEYTVGTGFYNATEETINVGMGLEFVDETGTSTFKFASDPENLSSCCGWNEFNITTSAFPTKNGTYKVYPAYYDGNNKTSNRLHVMNTLQNYNTVQINNGTITITQPGEKDAQLKCTLNHTTFYAGKYATVTGTFVNTGTDAYSNDVIFGCYDSSSGWATYTVAFVDLEPGDTTEVSIRLQAPDDTQGTYYLYVVNADYYLVNNAEVVEIKSVPSGYFAGKLTTQPVASVDTDNKVIIDTKATSTAGFEDKFLVLIFNASTSNLVGYMQCGQALGKGDTEALHFEECVPKLEPETKYTYCITAYKDGYNTTLKYNTTSYFNFTTPKALILGDANGDGEVTVSDFTAIANYILGNPPAGFNEKAADVNEDGEISVSDLTGVANIILQGE